MARINSPTAKKNRRNRHYEKQFIRNALTQRVMADGHDLHSHV